MSVTVDEMRVWVGCLACYNAGHLVGHWVDATEAGDKTSADIHTSGSSYWTEGTSRLVDLGERDKLFVRAEDEMVFDDLGCPHEELWVFDHEGFGDALKGECSPCEAQRIAEALEPLDEDERLAFGSWYESGYDDLADAVSDFRERWYGVWDSEKDFAYDFAEQTEEPGHDGHYFDWNAYARDLFLDGFTSYSVSGYRVAVVSDN